MSRNELTLRSNLTATDIDGILAEFADGKWKWKDLIGEDVKKSEKSPCIKVHNWKAKHRGLYCTEAIWLVVFGALPPWLTVSHHCSCKKTNPHNNHRVSPCVNIHHMRSELVDINSGRNGHQRDLKVWRQRNLRDTTLKGPQFIDVLTDEHGVNRGLQRCEHDQSTAEIDSCFINCGRIRSIKGLFWYNPPPVLLRNTNRRPIAFTFDMRNRNT